MPETCEAAVFVGAEIPLEIREFPVPDVGSGEVLIKMNMSAVCGTDAHNWYNPNAPHPIIWGHENIGNVAGLGAGVTADLLGERLHEGDRVLFHSSPCGHCYNCVMGLRCTSAIHYGNSHVEPSARTFLRGGFGQYLLLDPNPAIIRIPDDMSSERALMAVIGNHTVMGGLRKIDSPAPGDTVVIQGSGPIGMGALVQARIRGAARVIVIGAPRNRLELATELGADDTISIDDYPTPTARIERVHELTNRGPDLVIEASGAQTSVSEGLGMVRYGGKYLVIGLILPTSIKMDPSRIAAKDLTIAGVVGSKIENIIRSLRLMHSRVEVPVERMITDQFPLWRVNDALQSHVNLSAMVPVVNHRLKRHL